MQPMKPTEWLSSPGFELARKATLDWLWTDYPAWAQHRFGTAELTEFQFADLVQDLLGGQARRLGLDQGKRPEPVELRPNRANYQPGPIRFYLSGHRVKLGFPDPDSALRWGFYLVRKSGLGWFKALSEVQEKLDLHSYATRWRGKLGAFSLGDREIIEDPVLIKVLRRREREWATEQLPLPDSTPVDRQYVSMDRGVLFEDPTGRHWQVDRVAHKLDDYPELILVPKED